MKKLKGGASVRFELDFTSVRIRFDLGFDLFIPRNIDINSLKKIPFLVAISSETKKEIILKKFKLSKRETSESLHTILKSGILGDKIKLLSENLKVTISFLDEKPLSIDLPTNIDCVIESTDAVIKGQTVASSYKPAKLKNGLDIMVPPFIESGNKIVLDTRTLEYVKKIN